VKISITAGWWLEPAVIVMFYITAGFDELAMIVMVYISSGDREATSLRLSWFGFLQ
jgi:hypothetical protein